MKREREIIECKLCGTKFEKRHYAMKFCKQSCRDEYHNAEKRRLIELGRQYDAD